MEAAKNETPLLTMTPAVGLAVPKAEIRLPFDVEFKNAGMTKDAQDNRTEV